MHTVYYTSFMMRNVNNIAEKLVFDCDVLQKNGDAESCGGIS